MDLGERHLAFGAQTQRNSNAKMNLSTKLHNATLRTPKRTNSERISVDGDAMPSLPETNSLQFRIQMNGGQTALKYCCVNTVDNQILTVDEQALRLWTLRKEIKRAAIGKIAIGVVHVKSENFLYVSARKTVVQAYKSIPLSPNQHDIATLVSIVGHKSSEVSLWWPSLRKFAQKKLTLSTAKEDMVAIAFSQKRMELITSGCGGALVIWILKNRDTLPNKKRKAKKVQAPQSSGPYENKWLLLPRCSFFNNAGIKLLEVDEQHGFLLGASDTSIRIWDQKSANMLKDYASVNLSRVTAPITSLFYDNTNKYCLVGYEDGQIMVWHLDVNLVAERVEPTQNDTVNTTKTMLPGHSRAVTAVSVVPTVPGTGANAFLTCGAEGRILQWDIKSFQHQGAFQFKYPSTSVAGVSINEKLRPVPRQILLMQVATHNFVKNVIVVMAGNSLVVFESRAPQKPLLTLNGEVVSVCVRDDIKDEAVGGQSSTLTVPPADRIYSQHLVCMTVNEHVVVLDPDLENNSMYTHDSFSCQSSVLTQLPTPQLARTKTEPRFIHVRKGARRGVPQLNRSSTAISDGRITAVPKTVICKWDAGLRLFVLGRSDGSVHLVNGQREVVTSFKSETDTTTVTALCTAVSPKPQRTSKPGVTMPPMHFVVYASAEGTLTAHPIAVVLPRALRGPKTVPPPVSFVAHSSPVVAMMQMPLTQVGLGSGCVVSVEAAGAVKIWSPPPKLGARGFFTATGRGAFVGAKITAATLIENPANASVSILLGFESGALWVWRVPASLKLPKAPEASYPAAHRRRVSAIQWLKNSKSLVDYQGQLAPRLFASASTDQSIKLWNADTFEELRSFTTSEPVDNAAFYLSPPRDGVRELHILTTSEKSIFSVRTGYNVPLGSRVSLPQRQGVHTPPSRALRSALLSKNDKQQLSATAPSAITGGSSISGSPRSTYSAERDMSLSASAKLFSESWDRKASSTLTPLTNTGTIPSLSQSEDLWASKTGMFEGVHRSQPLGRLVPVHNTAPAPNLAGLQPTNLTSLNTFHARRRPATTNPNRRLSTRNKKLTRVTFDEHGRKVTKEVNLSSIYENSNKNMDSNALKKQYQHVPSKTNTNNTGKGAKSSRRVINSVPFPFAFRSLWLVPDQETLVTFSQPDTLGLKSYTEMVKKKGSFPTLGNSESPMTLAATVNKVWELYILRLEAQKQQSARQNMRGKLKGSTLSRVMKRRYLTQHEDTFANFVYQTFQRRAGVQLLAQERLLRLLDSLLLHQDHPACKLCGRFLTLFGRVSHLLEGTFRIFGSIMLPLFNDHKLWSPQTRTSLVDLVTAQSKPAPFLETMYVAEQDFINQTALCLSGFIDPVFLQNVFTIVGNIPRPDFDNLVDAHRVFLEFLDLWEKRRKVEQGGAEVLFKLSRRVSSEAQSEEQQRRRYMGLQGLHGLLKQFLLMDRDRIGLIKRADFADLLTHSSLMAGCTQRELDKILNNFSVVDFNNVPAVDEDLVLIPYQHLWLTLRSLLTQSMPAPVSPVSTEIKLGLECLIIEDVHKGAFKMVVNNDSEFEEYYTALAGSDYEQIPLHRRELLECIINPGGANEELVHLVGFGSALLLHDELKSSHLVGEVLRVFPSAEWMAKNRPMPPNIPKQLPLLAHAAYLQSLHMLPAKGSIDYRRFENALKSFQSSVYLGHGKPEPLPPFAPLSTKQPVTIIDASMKAKLQPDADKTEVKTEVTTEEKSEVDPAGTESETKTVEKTDDKVEGEGTAAATDDSDKAADEKDEKDEVQDAAASAAPTTDTAVPEPTEAVTETVAPLTDSKDSQPPMPLWDRLSRTPLQSKRSAQVAREQKVDAGPAGGSLDLTLTLGIQPQSDLYLDIAPKLHTETRGLVPQHYSGPLDGVLQFHRPPLRARLDQKPDSRLMVASRFRRDPLYLKNKRLNPLTSVSWPKDLRNNFPSSHLGIQIIPPHVFIYFENMAKQRKLVRALQDCFYGAVKTDRSRNRMQIPLSFLPLLLSFLEHVGVILPAYVYDMARKVRKVLVQQSRGSGVPSNADAVLATMFNGVDVKSFDEDGSAAGMLRRKLLTPAQQRMLRDARYRHALALLARNINWGPPYKSWHVNEDDLDSGGNGTKQKSREEAMDPREKHKLEKIAQARRELEAKRAADAEYARLLEQQRLESIALAERQHIEEMERLKREKDAEREREAAERSAMAKADAESAEENELHEAGYFGLNSDVMARLNLSGNPQEDRIRIKEMARRNGMAQKQWMMMTLKADRQRAEMEAKMTRLANAQENARKFLTRKGKSAARKARATKWLHKKGKHAANQALAEKRLQAIGRRQVRMLANRAREMKLRKYRAKKILSKIGRHAANCNKAEAFLRGLGKTHVKALAAEAKRAKFAADLKDRRDEALEYLTRLSQIGLQQCRARKYLHGLGQHWLKTYQTQAAAKAELRKLGESARARASAEAWCREEGQKAIEYIKVMIMLEKQKPKPEKKKKKKPPPLTPRKSKRNKLQRLRDKLGSAMRFSKVGKDHRIKEVERMKTQMLMMAKIQRFRNRISDADILRRNPVHDVKPLPDAVAIKVLNFNENIQVRSLLSVQNDTFLPQWTPEENNDASDEEFDALLEEDLEDATTKQRRQYHSSPIHLEGGVTIDMDKKGSHWKEFFDVQAKKIHDTMSGMFVETEDSSDRPVVASNYAKLREHREQQEALEREKKRKEANKCQTCSAHPTLTHTLTQRGSFPARQRKRRKAKEERERRQRMQRGERAVSYFNKQRDKVKDDADVREAPAKLSKQKQESDNALKKQRIARKRRAEALKSGEIQVNALPFDEWKTASCAVGSIIYFEVLLPEGRPLVVNVDVKRGAAKLFMTAEELPSETDATWSAHQYTMETHSYIALYPDDPRYKSDVPFYIGVCCGSDMGTRFRIQASCLQVAESEVAPSLNMKNATANMEKIQTIYSRLRPSVDDPDEDDELDAIEAELEAGLLAAGIVTLNKQSAKKTTDVDEDDDTSEEHEDGFSDVSSVDSLPSDLKNRLMEFNT